MEVFRKVSLEIGTKSLKKPNVRNICGIENAYELIQKTNIK